MYLDPCFALPAECKFPKSQLAPVCRCVSPPFFPPDFPVRNCLCRFPRFPLSFLPLGQPWYDVRYLLIPIDLRYVLILIVMYEYRNISAKHPSNYNDPLPRHIWTSYEYALCPFSETLIKAPSMAKVLVVCTGKPWYTARSSASWPGASSRSARRGRSQSDNFGQHCKKCWVSQLSKRHCSVKSCLLNSAHLWLHTSLLWLGWIVSHKKSF